uniref:Cyclin N-terminal domain-containing protein n=1 Tax=Anopheles epiroticus TaxID=199890 RepID=A0A182PBS0_9DIPT
MAPQAATATVIVPSTTSVVTPGTSMVANIPVNNTTVTASNHVSVAAGIDHLSCQEIIYEDVDNRFAEPDRHMINDDRVIQNLIRLERLSIPDRNYFNSVQQDIKPNMRKIVTTWMLEVCDEQKCEEQTFPLAVNFFDRFLCALPIDRYHLQLLGCCTLLLASKIRQCQPLTVDVLSAYTDHAVSPDQIRVSV